MQEKIIITPKTKILDLISSYPELEEVLFDISPAFKQLKNPLLRRTVARVTTLQQAALVGGMKVEDLVNRLRGVTGQDHIEIIEETQDNHLLTMAPVWFEAAKITQRLDAREMLNRGEHPVGQVLAELQLLPADGIYELIAPFFPVPLIDKASGIGFLNYVKQISQEEFHVYFIRLP